MPAAPPFRVTLSAEDLGGTLSQISALHKLTVPADQRDFLVRFTAAESGGLVLETMLHADSDDESPMLARYTLPKATVVAEPGASLTLAAPDLAEKLTRTSSSATPTRSAEWVDGDITVDCEGGRAPAHVQFHSVPSSRSPREEVVPTRDGRALAEALGRAGLVGERTPKHCVPLSSPDHLLTLGLDALGSEEGLKDGILLSLDGRIAAHTQDALIFYKGGRPPQADTPAVVLSRRQALASALAMRSHAAAIKSDVRQEILEGERAIFRRLLGAVLSNDSGDSSFQAAVELAAIPVGQNYILDRFQAECKDAHDPFGARCEVLTDDDPDGVLEAAWAALEAQRPGHASRTAVQGDATGQEIETTPGERLARIVRASASGLTRKNGRTPLPLHEAPAYKAAFKVAAQAVGLPMVARHLSLSQDATEALVEVIDRSALDFSEREEYLNAVVLPHIHSKGLETVLAWRRASLEKGTAHPLEAQVDKQIEAARENAGGSFAHTGRPGQTFDFAPFARLSEGFRAARGVKRGTEALEPEVVRDRDGRVQLSIGRAELLDIARAPQPGRHPASQALRMNDDARPETAWRIQVPSENLLTALKRADRIGGQASAVTDGSSYIAAFLIQGHDDYGHPQPNASLLRLIGVGAQGVIREDIPASLESSSPTNPRAPASTPIIFRADGLQRLAEGVSTAQKVELSYVSGGQGKEPALVAQGYGNSLRLLTRSVGDTPEPLRPILQACVASASAPDPGSPAAILAALEGHLPKSRSIAARNVHAATKAGTTPTPSPIHAPSRSGRRAARATTSSRARAI